jgi:NAD-dependent deacetylase
MDGTGMYKEKISEAAERIAAAKKITALTGAGISVASGIMPFRGKGGLWEKYDPAEVAEISRFRKDPGKSWIALKEIQQVVEKALPNKAHFALAKLEEMGYLLSVITQNVDGLHQAAGNRKVIEFHGNTLRLVCLKCNSKYPSEKISLDSLPPLCPACMGVLKPDAVFFGEMIPVDAQRQSQFDILQSGAMLVVGTSALVEPAASLPLSAKRNGAFIIEVNPEPSALTRTADLFIEGKAEEILPLIVDELLKKDR